MNPRLSIENLVIEGPQESLGPWSAVVEPGKAVVLVGGSGGGKSLLAAAVLGVLPPGLTARGTLHWGDTALDLARPDTWGPWRGSRVWSVPQEPREALDPTMELGRQWDEVPGATQEGWHEACRLVDLDPAVARAYPDELSGGMAQRFLVSLALASSAPFIVADEPTKCLDPERIDQSLDLWRRLKNQGKGLLIITHDPAVVDAVADEVWVVDRGRVVEGRTMSS